MYLVNSLRNSNFKTEKVISLELNYNYLFGYLNKNLLPKLYNLMRIKIKILLLLDVYYIEIKIL